MRLLDDALLREREKVGRRLCGGLYIRSCSGLTSFARARFINVMRTNFFSSKSTPQRLPFVCKERKERREEERRGRKVYHFNLTFLRMRVNNTYPMESYFFPLKTTSACTLHAECFTVRERETDRVSPRTANHLSIKQRGAHERSLSCYHPRTDHSVHVAFTRLSTSFPLPNELSRLRTHRMIFHRH